MFRQSKTFSTISLSNLANTDVSLYRQDNSPERVQDCSLITWIRYVHVDESSTFILPISRIMVNVPPVRRFPALLPKAHSISDALGRTTTS